MNKLELLKKARSLLQDPARWTQGVNAKDAAGNVTLPNSNGAHCFCALGALMKAQNTSDVFNYHVSEVYEELRQQCGGVDPIVWNDVPGRRHDEVLALFDRTIERLS